MYELLTEKWKVEPNVAVFLINIYGGHIYDVNKAFKRLYLQKKKLDYYLDPILYSNVLK